MISYKIVSRNEGKSLPKGTDRQIILPTDPEFKERVFQRSLQRYNNSFTKGDFAKVRGTSLRGTIIQVYQDFELVQWDKNKPLYVEIELISGERRICHPQQLKRTTKL